MMTNRTKRPRQPRKRRGRCWECREVRQVQVVQWGCDFIAACDECLADLHATAKHRVSGRI